MRLFLPLLLFLGLAVAQVRFLPSPGQAGAPGEYLTLSLRVEGQGTARFRLEAPRAGRPSPPSGWWFWRAGRRP
jgi:hypothetical protein